MSDQGPSLYVYRAKIRSVYDGDTFRADLDLGFDIWVFNQPFRLFGLDTPELSGSSRLAGLVAKSFVTDRLKIGMPITIASVRDRTEKYGRFLAVVYYTPEGSLAPVCLNDELLTAGHATPKPEWS